MPTTKKEGKEKVNKECRTENEGKNDNESEKCD